MRGEELVPHLRHWAERVNLLSDIEFLQVMGERVDYERLKRYVVLEHVGA